MVLEGTLGFTWTIFMSKEEFVMIQVCQRQDKINCFLDKLHKKNNLYMVGKLPEYSTERRWCSSSLGKQ